MKIKSKLNQVIKRAFESAKIEIGNVSVSDASKPAFGDYQFNGVMGLAKKLRRNPRGIALEVLNHIKSPIISKVEVAGAGFINIWIDNEWLSHELSSIVDDKRVGVELKSNPERVVVDYSGPNMAKQMHVGHLRSTIIGDTLASLLEFLGDEVIRQNHIGDWGTQFGMLIAYLEELGEDKNSQNLQDLEQFYKDAKVRFDSSPEFADRAREYVVKLQQGDSHCLRLWQEFIDISLGHCEEVYRKLGVKLTRDDVRAESFYNPELPKIIGELEEKGLLVDSNGAKCVFLEGSDTPTIVQKSDGGYLYATTDLAGLRFRVQELKAQRVCYVVDARQSEHFKQVFQIARLAGFVSDSTKLEHIAFGTMMDKGGKPFKTRDGGTVKLIDLLDEAVIRAEATISQRDIHSESELASVAEAIGIGAVKYADLSINRESNYIFSWDKMLSFDGNTALYLQYAYARIHSIFRKYGKDFSGKIKIGDELEHRLGVMILKFEDTLLKTSIDATPHTLTTYLYDLVTLFMKFYEQNPILKDEVDENTRVSRLLLARLTANTIRQGLEILGIKVVSRI
jgi:arginyl-tRNA synthetase